MSINAISIHADRLRPQEDDHKQLQNHLYTFMQQVECARNNVFSLFYVSALSNTPPTKNPAAENLVHQMNTVANAKLVAEPAACLVEHLQSRLFDRLYPERRPAGTLNPLSKTEMLQLTENTGGDTQAFLCLEKQKKELEKARLALDSDFEKNQDALNEAENNLPQYRGITGRIKEFFFFWRTWRDAATRRDFQANFIAAKEWHVAQRDVLNQALAKLDKEIATLQQISFNPDSHDISTYQGLELVNATAVVLRQPVLLPATEQAAGDPVVKMQGNRDSGIFEEDRDDESSSGSFVDIETNELPGMRSRHDSGIDEQSLDTEDAFYLEESEINSIFEAAEKIIDIQGTYLLSLSKEGLREADDFGLQELFNQNAKSVVETPDTMQAPESGSINNYMNKKEYYQLAWISDAKLEDDAVSQPETGRVQG